MSAETGVSQGPPAPSRPRGPYDFAKFNEKMRLLEAWRSADHEDNIALSRNFVIEIIEGVKALRLENAQRAER